jgi:hypothetical protein
VAVFNFSEAPIFKDKFSFLWWLMQEPLSEMFLQVNKFGSQVEIARISQIYFAPADSKLPLGRWRIF